MAEFKWKNETLNDEPEDDENYSISEDDLATDEDDDLENSEIEGFDY